MQILKINLVGCCITINVFVFVYIKIIEFSRQILDITLWYLLFLIQTIYEILPSVI